MAYAQTNSLSLIEGRVLEGEKGLAYWCMPAILHFLFFHLILSSLFCHFFFLFPFFFSFLLLTHVLYNDVAILSRGSHCPLLCMAMVLFMLPAVIGFYHFSL